MQPFDFRVYSLRHDKLSTYIFTKTKDGWHIRYIAIGGDATPDGAPVLYDNFLQDGIAYPSTFGAFLNQVWQDINLEELSNADAQTKLQELADWVSDCERSQPKWKGWNV